MTRSRTEKRDDLHAILTSMSRVVVALSGGLDSSFLFYSARQVLGENAVAVTLKAPVVPDDEFLNAQRIADHLGAPLEILALDLLSKPDFKENSADRCYICKNYIFKSIVAFARNQGFDTVIEGSNVDDLDDYRPGMRALKELGIRSPLLEAGLTKPEIRQLAESAGLPNWDQASMACLASRIPYGDEITEERLRRVDRAEKILRQHGFRQFRVRDHNRVARIEICRQEMDRCYDSALQAVIAHELKSIGYRYVTLDLEGYRTGAMNEVLNLD